MEDPLPLVCMIPEMVPPLIDSVSHDDESGREKIDADSESIKAA
jgi:hypothetical protein